MTFDQIFKVVQFIGILVGIVGTGAGIAFAVNRNFNEKFSQDKKDREQREQARVQEMVLVHEGLTATGHLAREVAEAHLAKCGQNEKIKTALAYHDRYREKEDEQMRQNAASLLHCERGA